jgi:hypothetical protein
MLVRLQSADDSTLLVESGADIRAYVGATHALVGYYYWFALLRVIPCALNGPDAYRGRRYPPTEKITGRQLGAGARGKQSFHTSVSGESDRVV